MWCALCWKKNVVDDEFEGLRWDEVVRTKRNTKYKIKICIIKKNTLPFDEDDAVGVVVDDGARLTNTNTNTKSDTCALS